MPFTIYTLVENATRSPAMASTGSPAPRKTALIRKIRNTVALPLSMMRVKPEPTAIVAASAPIHRRISGASAPNTTPIAAAAAAPSSTIWPADLAAPSGSFSPIRRATTAVAAKHMPIATA